MTLTRLQSLTFAPAAVDVPIGMVVRHTGGQSVPIAGGGGFMLDPGARISTDTFFNAITVETWKTHCRITAIALMVEGAGAIQLRFGLHRSDGTHIWLAQHACDLVAGTPCRIAMPFWSTLTEGLLYCEFEGVSPRATITGGWYGTPDLPERTVRLGIIITHFKREQQVIAAAARIGAAATHNGTQLLGQQPDRDHIALVIVDNSRTLSRADVPAATIIPSPNLGGSGGFMQGLITLQDQGDFTHALFMDDDAACDSETICRTIAILAYCITPRTAVAGALLSQADPFRLIEKGAHFTMNCVPHHAGRDMRTVRDLLLAECTPVTPTYGAWWFLAFALRDVRHATLPFFVRGDDVYFSHANEFAILTMNGIACWGDDFGLKDGPFQSYFDTRHHLVHALLGDCATRDAANMVKGAFGGKLKCYRYADAAAVSLALADICKGPGVWAQNPDFSQARAHLATLAAEQQDGPVDLTCLRHVTSAGRPGRGLRLVRFVTCNGLFLPKWLLRRDAVYQSRQRPGRPADMFGYRQVWYVDEVTGIGFLARHDRARAMRERSLFKQRLRNFERNFETLRASYRAAAPDMSSRRYWSELFNSYAP